MTREVKAGVESSEFRQVRLAQRVGLGVLALGVLLVLAGCWFALWPIVVGGGVLAYVGGEVLEKTVAAYANARAAVKASAAAPPTTVVSPSVRVGAGKL